MCSIINCKLMAVVIGLFTVVATYSNASALTILDFEAPFLGGLSPSALYSQGVIVPTSSIVTNQYQNLGVEISGGAIVNLGVGHAASGSYGLAAITSGGAIDYDRPVTFSFYSPLGLNSKATTDYFGYSPDLWGGSNNIVTLTAYGLDNQIVGQATYIETGSFNPNSPLEIKGVGQFSRVTIDSTLFDMYCGGIGIDLVRIGDLNPAPVPEPSTFILLGAGIGGLVFLRRRSNR